MSYSDVQRTSFTRQDPSLGSQGDCGSSARKTNEQDLVTLRVPGEHDDPWAARARLDGVKSVAEIAKAGNDVAVTAS